MKLLICTQTIDKDDPILGFFHAWVIEFAKYFEQVDVICLKEGTHTLPQNVRVHSLGKETGESRMKYLWRFYRFFWNVYMRGHVDYVFFHMGAIYNILAAPFFLIRTLKHTKFYWWKTHGHINVVGKVALMFVDRVFTASPESFPVKTKKKVVVGHAIDVHQFTSEERSSRDMPTILFVGRIMPIKKVEYVIEAARTLNEHGVQFRVRIVGSVGNTKYKKKLEGMVEAANLENTVSFVGPRTHAELVHEYHEADILINPSETGSIDKVVLEAMLSGVIPLAAGSAYARVLAEFGLCVAHNDPKEYVKHIERILNTPGKSAELRLALREKVMREHALATLPRRVFDI